MNWAPCLSEFNMIRAMDYLHSINHIPIHKNHIPIFPMINPTIDPNNY